MDPSQPEEIRAYTIAQMLNQYAATFDDLCRERHEAGAQEYGELTFLENDVTRMMLEELADITNYCRMSAVKLLILQDRLEADVLPGVTGEEGKIDLGWQSFKGTKPAGWSE